jgi:hypothetical protein
VLQTLRPAPVRVLAHEAGLPFAVWMALARATPVPRPESEQRRLGEAERSDHPEDAERADTDGG